MAKFRVVMERSATFTNVLEMEADSAAQAHEKAAELARDIRRGHKSYELGMGKQEENPTAYVSVYSPFIVDIKEVK